MKRSMGLIAGVVIAGVFVAGTALAVVAPWPTAVRDPLSVTAVPAPEESVLACAGPILALGRDAEDAAGLTDAADQRLIVTTGDGKPDAAESRLAAPDVIDGQGNGTFRAEPDGRTRTDLAAAGSAQVTDDDLTGFAASACTPPLMESWLVGGSGLTGASDLILLANPGQVAARVELTVYGALGVQTPAAGRDILVPAGTQRVIPMASIALGEGSPTVRVTAAEAPVQASLQTSITRTLIPTGLDQVGPAAAPSPEQVIPAFTVVREPGDAGASDTTTLLRMLAPAEDTEATVEISRVGGGVVDTRSVPLTAAVPLELDLDGLDTGSYTARITAATPVTAALWETTGYGEGDDFAWYPSVEIVGVSSLFTVARGPSPVLTVTNDAEEEIVAQVVLGAGEGETINLTVRPGGSARYALRSGAVYQLVPGGDRVRASVTYSDSDRLAGYAVSPADAAAAAVEVFVQ
nr:DUF5719 family protein [Microbacterium aquimaris]